MTNSILLTPFLFPLGFRPPADTFPGFRIYRYVPVATDPPLPSAQRRMQVATTSRKHPSLSKVRIWHRRVNLPATRRPEHKVAHVEPGVLFALDLAHMPVPWCPTSCWSGQTWRADRIPAQG
ncbi:hypothetical protein C8R47DRAFT_677760 [Mycena vitilis]|nr:hypothetical protein C8R47DRAFT_677760 [Mycena vitilis]